MISLYTRVLCEVRADAEESVNDLNMTIEYGRL
jgi:hypothetical protein